MYSLREISDHLLRAMIRPYRNVQFMEFGKKSSIEKPSNISGGKWISIGSNVRIRNNARIEAYKLHKFSANSSDDAIISIGDRVGIEEGLHMTAAESVIIEDDVSILAYAMITDITHDFDEIEVRMNQRPLKTNPVRIKQFAVIGQGSFIMPGVTVGRNSFVGANTVVTKDVPDYSIVVGNPGKVIKKYDFATRKWEKVDESS